MDHLGFSDKLGPLRYETNQEEVFLGHSVAQQRNISDETARIIDEEVRKLVEIGEETSRKILTKKIDDLHKVAKGLLEYETLSGDEIKDLIKGIKPNRSDFDDNQDPAKPNNSTSVPKSSNKISPQVQ